MSATQGDRPTGATPHDADADPAKPLRRGSRPPATSNDPDEALSASARQRPVGSRAPQYLVAALPPHLLGPGVAPADPEDLFARLAATPGVQVRRRLRPPRVSAPAAVRHPHIGVVEMSEEHARELARRPELKVERNHPLRYLTVPNPVAPTAPTTPAPMRNPGTQPLAAPVSVAFLVTSTQGDPLPDAMVMVMGAGWSVQGLTGTDGRTALDLPDGTTATVSGVYVKPAFDHWEKWHASPDLSTEADNAIVLSPLSDAFPGFPGRQNTGWGWSALHMDRVPASYRGRGVRIAVIDSGAAALTHPDLLGRFRAGTDTVDHNDTGWTLDTVSHGTHCAGVITAADNGTGVLGLAPEAEVYSCKIFPGGAFSELLAALDYCLENAIDVVNLSLGGDQPSDLVSEKIAEARASGLACIVAAGNDGGAVSFPANLPTVFTVAAIGKTGVFPPDTYHAVQQGGAPDADGYFPAKFSCRGPEVDASAPGVAILSSVPPANYAVWDGTSMATPYITGLAALVLAHHPAFGPDAPRDGVRVDQLFANLRASCRPLDPVAFPGFGAGLPDATRALAVAAPPSPIGLATLPSPAATTAVPTGIPAPAFAIAVSQVVAHILLAVAQQTYAGPPAPSNSMNGYASISGRP